VPFIEPVVDVLHYDPNNVSFQVLRSSLFLVLFSSSQWYNQSDSGLTNCNSPIEFAIFFTFSLMFYPLGLVSLGLMFSKGVGFSEIFSRSFLLVTFYFFSICSLLQLSLAAIGWFPGPPIDDSMLPMVLGATPMGLVLAAAAHQVRLRQ